jgi:hypothetical protein
MDEMLDLLLVLLCGLTELLAQATGVLTHAGTVSQLAR